MNLTFRVFKELPQEAIFIRNTVFVKEQGFQEEFNSDDNNAIHIVMYLDSYAIATSRILYSNEHKSYLIGRFAVLKDFRSKHYGKQLLLFTEETIIKEFGHISIGVSAQERSIGFYEKCGYIKTNLTYLDENYPHTWMTKKL